ncbi:MAG TPA: site-2 protease family protein [Flavobacteriales bacterium]|nr:site-2 protease family protein [Flavobacteriales bacterium]
MATPRTFSAWHLFSFKGIPVRMHWSFLLLILYVVYSAIGEGMDASHVAYQVASILIVFTCVVLHEFGHALTALHYGVRTRDITLLPIGGVASLERIPEKPAQEFWITVAGPAVNLAIILLAIVPFLLLRAQFDPEPAVDAPISLPALLGFLIISNAVLFVFNIIPAFPMDGGRILRSVLAMRMDRLKATRIAATCGKVCAVGFVFVAFRYSQPMLGLIGVFVFMGASAEQRQAATQRALRGLQVRAVMRTRFWRMPSTATVQQAADQLLATAEHVLVVTNDERFGKIIPRTDLIAAFQQGDRSLPLENVRGAVPTAVRPDTDVRVAHDLLSIGQWPLLPVVENEVLIGIVELDNLGEYLALHGIQA